ncbi:hypothetical protein [Streptomyces griseus]|nr:hypothetical protein [Streptomyces griseus]
MELVKQLGVRRTVVREAV